MENFIQTYGMIISFSILAIAYVFIATEKIPKMTVALVGAGITLLLGLVGGREAFQYIDFNVIFLLVSMMIIVGVSAKSGMYDWVAIELLKLTKGKPLLILSALALFTAVVSAFLDNVTTVILIMPVTFIIAKQFNISPVPFLISEVLASNIGGTATLIGDPPNIIIGSKAGLSFLDFLITLTPVISVILFCAICILCFLFRKHLIVDKSLISNALNLSNEGTIKNKNLMIRSLIILALVIFGFVTHDITHIETYVSALAGASILLLFENPKEVLKEVEWNTLAFFVGLFIIIGGIEATGGIHFLAQKLIEVTSGSNQLASMFILWGSGIFSGFIDNIPYTATMAPLIADMSSSMDVTPLWWSLSLGACLGGNFTIIGAAANVIVSENANAKGHNIPFLYFMKYGAIISIISLIISSIYLQMKYFM